MQRHSSAKNLLENLSIGLFANVKVMKRTIEIIESDLELFMKWLDQKTCPELVKIDLKLKKINKCLLALLNFEEQFCFSSLMEEINYFKLKRPAIVKWDFFFRQLKVFEELSLSSLLTSTPLSSAPLSCAILSKTPATTLEKNFVTLMMQEMKLNQQQASLQQM